jgi:NADPH-dependent curcumin reductase CurA
VDIYFDNVGGVILEAALGRLNRQGRIVLCGATSQYDTASPPAGPSNYLCLLECGGRMQGFMASHYLPRFEEAVAYLSSAIADGRLVYTEHFTDGLQSAPGALMQVLRGDLMGRLMVRL